MYPSKYTVSMFLLLLVRIHGAARQKNHGGQADYQVSNAKMDPKETEALFEVMESMSADAKWRKAYPRPCVQGTWPGLECKQGNDNFLHVSRLNFGYKPNPSCKKNALFPISIFKLSYLQALFMFQCFMHDNVTIPFGFRKLAPSLEQLSLRANKGLTGEIPRDFGSLRGLQVLTLSQNNLQGSILPDLGRLNSLMHLDLSYNSFEGKIPQGMGSLSSLLGLDLSYNNLRGPIPESLGNLRTLQKLDLSSNSLTGHIPAALGNLNNLEFIALSNNKITGRFPPSLGSLQSLQYFIMDKNPMFSPLPVELGNLRKLQELRLASSGYSGSIPVGYGKLVNLSSLNLENNRLSGRIPSIIGNLSHMYHLNLSGNMLSGALPFSSEFLHRLGKNIDLKGNLGLCVNASQAMQRSQYLGVDVCGALPIKAKGKSPKKSMAVSLYGMHWRINMYLMVSWIVCALLA